MVEVLLQAPRVEVVVVEDRFCRLREVEAAEEVAVLQPQVDLEEVEEGEEEVVAPLELTTTPPSKAPVSSSAPTFPRRWTGRNRGVSWCRASAWPQAP